MNKELINKEIKKFNIDMKEIKKIYDNTDIKKFNQHKPLSTLEISTVFITIYLLCFIIYKYINKKNN
jgi:hypothetical protein